MGIKPSEIIVLSIRCTHHSEVAGKWIVRRAPKRRRPTALIMPIGRTRSLEVWDKQCDYGSSGDAVEWKRRYRTSCFLDNAMKKPTLRVTKWLSDIPVEAYCSACSGVTFRAKGSGHRPNREEYQHSLQEQFDAHLSAAHSPADPAEHLRG